MSGRPETTNIIPGRAALSVGMPPLTPPRGWAWVKLSEIARLETGHTPSRESADYWDGDVPWIGIRDARAHHGGVIESTQQRVTQAGLDNSAARLLPAGTVCLSRTASVGYVVVMGRPMATSQDFVNWSCSDALDPHFLKYLLVAERESLDRFSKGSTHSTIYFPEVKAFHVCIPGIAEQRRIVSKLDDLLVRSGAARESVTAIPALTERYRRSVLLAAFRGMHEDSCDSFSLESLLPTGRTITYGIVQTGTPTAGGVPTVRCGDIKRFSIEVDALKRVAPNVEAQYPRTRLKGGEVLLAIRGSVGEVAVAPPALAGANVSREVAVIPAREDVEPEYLMYLLASPVVAAAINTQVKGVAQSGINIGDLRRIRVPLPPRERQIEVVKRVRHTLAGIDRLTECVATARRDLDLLEQATLRRAFRGELVPQHPANRSAERFPSRPGNSEVSAKRRQRSATRQG